MIEQSKKETDYGLITEKLDDYLFNLPKKVIAGQ